MDSDLKGTFVELQLSAGEAVFTEARKAAWIVGEVEVKTSLRGSIDLKKEAAEESIFMTTYRCLAGEAIIAMAHENQESTFEMEMAGGYTIIARRGVLLAADTNIKIERHVNRKLESGSILRKISGAGKLFWELTGGFRQFDLENGQEIRVETALISMYEPSVGMEAIRLRGAQIEIGSSNEISMTALRGTGRVWLQGSQTARK